MSQSTNGEICYGTLLPDPDEEDVDLPWADDDDGIEGWWRTETGYVPSREIYAAGDYIGGERPPQSVIDAYYDERKPWDETHPIPVEVVNACSGEYPLWILAVKGSVQTARRGYPVAFDPAALVVAPEALTAFEAFLAKYFPEAKPASWHLSSYMG